MQIIELLTPHYEAAWLPWAVQYFFLVGVATGAAILAALCAWGKDGGTLQRLLPAAVLTLAVSAIAAPVSLLADLHQPARFWHFYPGYFTHVANGVRSGASGRGFERARPRCWPQPWV